MLSLQGQSQSQSQEDHPQTTSSQAPTDPKNQIWKSWSYSHPELRRVFDTKISYDGKMLIVGGFNFDRQEMALNIVLVDPETQKLQVITSVGDVKSCCCDRMSACNWRDSQIVVFGGFSHFEPQPVSTIAVVTLKDLDSENPSAHWEKIVTPTEQARTIHSAHIYNDKMFVFGGCDERWQRRNELWCLDLVAFTWSQCDFPSDTVKDNSFDATLSVFHENKAYMFLQGFLGREKVVMGEFDFETLSWRTFTIPPMRVDTSSEFKACPQMIDGKIYIFEYRDQNSKNPSRPKEICAYDLSTLSSESWTEIKTGSFASLSQDNSSMLFTNNQIIFESHAQYWSLELNPSRSTTKASSTSATSKTVNKVQHTLKEFFFEAPCWDISFEVEDQTIPAHKWLLAQRSNFFASLFSEDSCPKVDLKPPTFRALLEYLYSDHVKIDDTIALELLQKAEKYSIPGELKNGCEKHLLKNIHLENYVAFGKLAESINASSLREAVVVFIAINMKKIKSRKDFNDISDALLRDS